MIAVAGIAFQWQSEAAFPWWRVGVALLLLGLVWEWRCVRRCRLRVSVDAAPLRLGQPGEVAISVASDEQRALRLQYSPDLPTALDFDAVAISSSGLNY